MLLFFLSLVCTFNVKSQEPSLTSFEQRVAAEVLSGNLAFLRGVYADDFVFTHGTGTVQNKEEWLSSVERTYNRQAVRSRIIGEQSVEAHGEISITRGKITVDLVDGRNYWVDYVRVYKNTEKSWLMLSHITVDGSYRE